MSSITSLPLRHALYFLKNEETPLLKYLLPVETLCRQKLGSGSIKDYKMSALTGENPLFEKVQEAISLLTQYLSHNPEPCEHYTRIRDFYQAYIQRMCQVTGKERSHLLKGRAIVNIADDASLLKQALAQKQDELVYYLITPSSEPFLPCLPCKEMDSEKAYTDWLIDAQEKKNVTMQVLVLEKLSHVSLSENRKKITTHPNDFALAAYFLNAAIALAQKGGVHPLFISYLFESLEDLEKKAFQAFFSREMPSRKPGDIQARREELHHLRQEFKKRADDGVTMYPLLAEITGKIRHFFATLIEKSIVLSSIPKIPHAFIGMGSMLRLEMCPYSDIEFAVLLEDDKEENKAHFRNVVRFLEILVINLGESEFLVGKDPQSPTPHGFSFDKGGNVPVGGVWELIGTPQKLSSSQTLNSLEENLVTSNALTYVCLITSSEGREHSSLCEHYRKAVIRQLETYVDGSWFSLNEKERIHQRRALILLKGHLKEFELNLSPEKEKERVFGVKKELYRLIQSSMDALALFFNLKNQSTQLRIREMVKTGILNEKGGKFLTRTVERILMFRLQAQFFYKDGQRDYLYHPRLSDPKSDEEVAGLLQLSDEYIHVLEEIFQTLYPFYYAIKKFFQTNAHQSMNAEEEVTQCERINTLKEASFHIDLVALAQIFHKSLRPNLAERIIQQAIALNPNNTKALKLFVEIKLALGKQGEAQQYIQEQLDLVQQTEQQDEVWIEVVSSLNLLGKSFQLSHAFKHAQHFHDNALNMLETYLPEGQEGEFDLNFESTILLIDTLRELATSLQALEDFELAEQWYQGALTICQNNLGNNLEEEIFIAFWKKMGDLNWSLGTCFHQKGNVVEALKYFEEAFYRYSIITAYCKGSAAEKYHHTTSHKLSQMKSEGKPFSVWLQTKASLDTVQGYEDLHCWLVDQEIDISGDLLAIDTLGNKLVNNQIRQLVFCKTIALLNISKIQCDSSNNEEREGGIKKIVQILELYKNRLFVEEPIEAIIECYLSLAPAYFKEKKYELGIQSIEQAFKLAEDKKMYALLPRCLSVFVNLFDDSSAPLPDNTLLRLSKILNILKEMKEEGVYLLVPALLEFYVFCRKFYSAEGHGCADQAFVLIHRYGKENFPKTTIEKLGRIYGNEECIQRVLSPSDPTSEDSASDDPDDVIEDSECKI